MGGTGRPGVVVEIPLEKGKVKIGRGGEGVRQGR